MIIIIDDERAGFLGPDGFDKTDHRANPIFWSVLSMVKPGTATR
jgi:hypothetical protein